MTFKDILIKNVIKNEIKSITILINIITNNYNKYYHQSLKVDILSIFLYIEHHA